MAVASADEARSSGREAASRSALPAVAVLPLHNRAGKQYDRLAHVATLAATTAIHQSGRALVVDRAQIEHVLDEKLLAATDLADKQELAAPGRVSGADFILSGHLDVSKGRLRIKFELMHSGSTDFGSVSEAISRDFPAIVADGHVDDVVKVLDHLHWQVCDLLPQVNSPASPRVIVQPDANYTIAVFDFAASAADDRTRSLANALCDAMQTDLLEALPAGVVERQRLRDIMKEKRLAWAGLTQETQAVKAGKLIGADFVLVGAVLHHGSTARLDVQVLDVATSGLVAASSVSGSYQELLGMHRNVSVALAKPLGAGRQRLHWLRRRPSGSSPEALAHAWRAYDTVFHGRGPMQDRRKQALRLLQLALDLEEQSPQVLLLAGSIHWKWKNLDLAEHYLRKAVELDPGSFRANEVLARFLRKARQDPHAALAFARRAVKLGPLQRAYLKPMLALCLLEAGQLDEAQQVAEAAVNDGHDFSGWRQDSQYDEREFPHAWSLFDGEFEILARVYEARNNLSAAARWRYVDACKNNAVCTKWKMAREAYQRIGVDYKAMDMFENRVRLSCTTADERLEMAKYHESRRPLRAAANCYRLIEMDKHAGEARAILERMGQPLESPLLGGPVFDLEGMREKGIAITLRPYEDFRHVDQVRYLRDYLEDMLGVPTSVSEVPHPVGPASYRRSLGNFSRLGPSRHAWTAADSEAPPNVVLRLTSLSLTSGSSGRWGVGRGLVTSAPWDRYFFEQGVADERSASLGFGFLQESALGLTYLALLPRERFALHCVSSRCATSWRTQWRRLNLDRGICADCRKTIYDYHPDWPRGVAERAPIKAGPTTPAVAEPQRPILLLTLGATAEQVELGAMRRTIEATTGLPVVSREEPTVPAFPLTKNGWYQYEHVLAWAAKQRGDSKPAAICVVFNGSVAVDKRTQHPWHMWRPGNPDVPDDVNCPVIGICLFRDKPPWPVAQALQHVERVELPAADGSQEEVKVPQYGKWLVGALALAARDDQQCWTYGCPSTVWEDIGMPHRCSHWLCPTCRQAMVTTYARSTAKDEKVP